MTDFQRFLDTSGLTQADYLDMARKSHDVFPGFLIDPTVITGEPEPEIAVRKLQTFVPVSCCALTDATGVNHCDHETTPAAAPPWPRRALWRVRAWWSHVRLAVGSWVAGVDLAGLDDPWRDDR